MKKVLSLVFVSIFVLLLTACDFGDYHYDDPKDYRRTDGSFLIKYFPKSINDFTVNSYSYNTYRFLDTCTEDFLDITVTADQFDELIQGAKDAMGIYIEQTAYYNPDYTEIIQKYEYDSYIHDLYSYNSGSVDRADIYKVIYNKKTNNIIYEYFYGIDSDVYPISEIAYFNRFNISSAEYLDHCYSPYEEGTEVVTGFGF